MNAGEGKGKKKRECWNKSKKERRSQLEHGELGEKPERLFVKEVYKAHTHTHYTF